MKLFVFPEAQRAEVEAVVREALRPHRGGTDELTLNIVRLATHGRWSVQMSGLGDAVLEQGWCELVEHALNDAGL